MCVNDNTKKHMKMDVARLLVRTRCSNVLNKDVIVMVVGASFNIKVVEDSYDHLRLVFSIKSNQKTESEDIEGPSDSLRMMRSLKLMKWLVHFSKYKLKAMYHILGRVCRALQKGCIDFMNQSPPKVF